MLVLGATGESSRDGFREGETERAAGENESESIEARARWYLQFHGDGGRIDPERQRMRVAAEYARWRGEARSRGPKPLGVGGTEWISLGPTNGAGRMTAIVPVPGAPGTAYAGGAGGGVWKTADGGATWTSLTDGIHDLAVGAIALAPSSSNVVYVGTGEGGVGSSFIPGIGLLKSLDGGATWTLPDRVLASSFYRILVHPANANELVAGTSGGAFRSTDGGATWTNVIPRDQYGEIPDMVRDPSDPQTLYATTWCVHRDCGILPGRVLKSADGGTTWTDRSAGLPSTGKGGNLERMSIAISASSPSILYAARSIRNLDTGATVSHIYKTIDGGGTWTDLAGLASDPLSSQYLGGQSWYDNALLVSPTNPDVLYAGGVSYVRTSDGGATFKRDFDLRVHPDCHDLQLQGTTLWIANDGGIWTAPADDVRTAIDRNRGLVTRQFYALANDPSNRDRIIAGAQDNGTVQRLVGGTEWRILQGGDGGEAAVHPLNSSIAWFSFQGCQIYRTRSAGASGTVPIRLVAPPISFDEDFAPLRTIVKLDRRESETLYTGSSLLWVSRDGGDSWATLSTATTDGSVWDSFDTISAIALPAVASPLLLVAKQSGVVFRSDDRGRTWAAARGLPGRLVTHLELDPRDPLRAYASIATTNGPTVYRSDDGGSSWAASGAGLPSFAAQTIRVDPTDSTDLFCGTDVGVYRSTDRGATWSRFGTGLPSASVHDMDILPDGSVVRVATYGRGIWELQVPASTNRPPAVSIAAPAGDLSVAAGTPVDFAGTAADPDSGDVASGSWFFWDDGSVVALPASGSVRHTFWRGGVVPISLTAVDSHGARSTAAILVSVREASDDCAAPESIPSGGPFPYTVSVDPEAGTVGAADPSPPCQGEGAREGSTWLEFTPASAGTYRISPCGAQTVTVLSVFTGPACGPYSPVSQACRAGAPGDWDCTSPSSTPYVSVTASAGQTLRVLLSSVGSQPRGRVPLTISRSDTPAAAPRVLGVTASIGPPAGGEPVTVTGSGFTNQAAVTFGGVAASSVTVESVGILTALVPPHAPGAVDVAVTVPGAGTGTLRNGYRYASEPQPACVAGARTLCLNGGRFRVEAKWRVADQGQSGQGSAVPLTGDTGYFWFFSSNNIELVLKVVDGRPVNGRFWVFYGALSNVEYEITVTDAETGAVRVYANPSGQLSSVADTSAF